MYSEGRTRLHLGAATDWLPRWLSFLVPFSIVGGVLGQGILAPPPGFQGAPDTPQMGVPSWNASQVNSQGINGQQANGQINGQPKTEANGQEGTPSETGAAPIKGLMEWGALHLRARASYQFLYDTGVHSQPGQSSDTFTHTFTPGLTANIGPHVSLTYSPSFRFFSERNFHNTIDHFASLEAGVAVGDWTLSLSQSFSRSDEPLVETSSQTDQETFGTGLGASYQFNDKISFDTSVGLGLNYVSGGDTNTLSDSQSYSFSEWANYKFDEHFSGALGVTIGYSEQSGGFTSLSESYQGRVNWHPGQKLSLSISGGVEDEQFLNSNAQNILNPIFSASIGYQLFEQTSLSLNASRAVNASLFRNEITESTQVGIGLQQRLLGALHLSVGFGYGTSDFKETTGSVVTVRSDDFYSYNVGLGLPFLKRGNVATFYQYTKNSSSDTGFGFGSSQVGVTISWAY